MKWIIHILVVGISGFLCFYKLDVLPLERWDEQTNQQVTTELINGKTFPYLFLNNKPFFEKPPLWYFATGLVTNVFGLTIFSLRFVSAISGFVLLVLVYSYSYRQYSPLAALISIGILWATGHLYFPNPGKFFSTHHIRSADLDMLYILCMIFATVFFVIHEQTKSKIITLPITGIVCCALSIVTKGPLGVLPLVNYLIYVKVINKESITNLLLLSLFIFSIILLPWYFVMIYTHGQTFITTHIGYHLVTRTITTIEGHAHPWWYYFSLLTHKEVFPFFEILVVALILIRTEITKPDTFLLTSLLGSLFLIPQLAQTKIAWYIVPIYPLAALCIGKYFFIKIAHLQYETKGNNIIFYSIFIFTLVTVAHFTIQNLYRISIY